jgi:2,3,4,5-tetrahydropyridine-2-carboxylate N-succinyltransferase
MKMNWKEILDQLEQGTLRSAEYKNGEWSVNREVKEGILASFKAGELAEFSEQHYAGFVDKHNLPPRTFTPDQKIRLVPGGSSVRRGAYVAPGVIIMPPAYINVGAYVDEGTMVDSHALVGSCAQIGKRVHLSAGVQIGGVLEPIGMNPVIIEDDAFLAANVSVVEGIRVGKRAVLAPGVQLSASVALYDAVNEKVISLKEEGVPEGAVVVPGSRPVSDRLAWASEKGISLYCPVIVKYRDEKSDASLTLEEFLR